ncbi:MAG: hypothetical protein U5S82_14960 [Gammaproteobacteria bacterium]|nr:hypothetical protein [Gammaproteobacteria bacterium]
MIHRTLFLAAPMATLLTLMAGVGAAPRVLASPVCPDDPIADLQHHWHSLIAEPDSIERNRLIREHQERVAAARQALKTPAQDAAGRCQNWLPASRVHLRNMVEMHQSMLDMLEE